MTYIAWGIFLIVGQASRAGEIKCPRRASCTSAGVMGYGVKTKPGRVRLPLTNRQSQCTYVGLCGIEKFVSVKPTDEAEK